MSIEKFLVFEGTMTLKSGLHIGGNTDETKVGGCDNPIIKNKITGEPYIPGSSVKGAMRNIEENKPKFKSKITATAGGPCTCGQADCMICRMFGAHKNTQSKSGMSRLKVHEMHINKEFKEELIRSGETLDSLVDIKSGNIINRLTGSVSEKNGLRNMEIISNGTVFDCKFTLRILTGDNEKELINELKSIIRALEVQGIGSKTTSGLGQIEFDIDFDDPKEYKM